MTSMHARAAIAALTLAGALAGTGSAAANSPPSTVKCGDTLTRSVKLTADLTDCPADGLVIGAAGITVDLNGHTIDGTVTQTTDCDVAPSGPRRHRTPAATTASRSRTARSSSSAAASTRARTRTGWPTAPSAT